MDDDFEISDEPDGMGYYYGWYRPGEDGLDPIRIDIEAEPPFRVHIDGKLVLRGPFRSHKEACIYAIEACQKRLGQALERDRRNERS